MSGTGGMAGAGTGGSSGAGDGGDGGTGGSGPCNPAVEDCCPTDPAKTAPGVCGCGTPDNDSDGDGLVNCADAAPYGFLRRLTIDGAQVTGALTDFPLLVRVSDTHLRDNAKANGSDFYFTAADQTTLLDYEIERYTSAGGSLVAWVRIPSLSAGTDADFYLGYGDGNADRSDVAGVWAGYRSVWHLSQDPSGGTNAIRDATGQAHGTAQGGMGSAASVSGLAGQALNFDGVDDAVAFTSGLTGGGASTFSGWVNQADDPGDLGSGLISVGNGTSNQARFVLSQADQDRVKVGFYNADDLPNTVLPTGVWKHVVWVWNGTTSSVFVDGVSVQTPANHSNVNTTGTTGRIGASSFQFDYYLTGQIDEVRMMDSAMNAARVTAEFNSQRPSANFIKALAAPVAAAEH